VGSIDRGVGFIVVTEKYAFDILPGKSKIVFNNLPDILL
tara:strand:- start:259 stop:375 length:117 start_codon:yes stop_codon:yes gene_type:complete